MSDTASSRNDRKRDANSGEDDVQQVDEISPESSNQATETTPLLQNGNKEHGNNCRKLLCCCFPWCYERGEQEANDGSAARPIATGISHSAQSYNPSQKDVEVRASDSPPLDTERQEGSAISDDSMSYVGVTAAIHATVPPYDNLEKERIVCQATSSIDPKLNTQEKFNETGLATAEAGNLQECRNSSHQNDTSSTNMTTGLNPLSKYLGSLANKIGKHDLHVILFHAENLDHRPIHKRERENIKDPLSLFAKLQEAGHINENHCNVLVHLLQAAYLDMLAIEVSVRYELGFDEDVDDNDLKEMVNKKLRQLEQAKGWSVQSPLRPDGSPPEREIPCKTCQNHFKEREKELERKCEKTKSESKHYLFIVLQERNNAEMQNAKEHNHCDKEQEKLRIALAKSESDLKQVQDKLELAKQERTRLERQNEMTRKEVERVQDFHKKEKESLESAKSNSESISQQIQDQLDRVIQERTRLETQLTETKQEAAKVQDLQTENETFKITQTKLEIDVKQVEEKLSMIVEERNILNQQLQKKEDVEKKLTAACTKSKSDLKQVQDKLDKAIQERDTLERQLKMTKKDVEKVQDLHNKETERLEVAKSKSESVSQQIQDKLEKVTEERTRLEMQLADTKQEVAKIPDLQKENKKIKIAHDKLEDDIKQMNEKLDRIMQEKILLEQRLENTEKELACVQDQYKEAKEKAEMLIAKEKSRSKGEAKCIGGTKYIGEKKKVTDHHTDTEWTVQLLGSEESGTEPGQFNEPKGLAWHGDQLVICDRDNHRIQILNKNKVVIEIIRFDGQFDKKFKPYAVAISPDGHFFITDIGNNKIIICDQNKKIIQIIPQSADIEVGSITVVAAFIFVTDSKGKSLIKYNIKDGKLVARVKDQFSDPNSVMATSNNHLLVSDRDKHVIHVLDSDLNFLNSYRNERLKYPLGLDVDSHGNIYICKRQSRGIVKLRSDGQLDYVLFEGVGYYPEFIAVNDDITTTIAVTELSYGAFQWRYWSVHQIRVHSVST